jgi:hypothetical protein
MKFENFACFAHGFPILQCLIQGIFQLAFKDPSKKSSIIPNRVSFKESTCLKEPNRILVRVSIKVLGMYTPFKWIQPPTLFHTDLSLTLNFLN